jgi:ABC-2 type transport system permease protein
MNAETAAVNPNAPQLTSAPRLSPWRCYPRIYAALWRNSVVREMGFKTNFLLWLFVELLWFGLQLGFNSVIYLHTDSIATWTKWEVVMLIGASHFIQQMFQAFFLVNCAQLPELIHTGRMDFMMLLPTNTRFLVSVRHVDLGGFISAASGLLVMVYAAGQLKVSPSLAQIAAFGLLCAAAIMIHYSLMFLMATLSFWTVRAQGLVMAYYNLFSVARIPDAAFHGAGRVMFTLVVPMLIVANIPVKLLLDKLSSPAEIALMLAMTGATFGLSLVVWRLASRRYSSASS